MQAAEAKESLEVAVTGTFAAQKIEACGDVGEKATPTVANMDAVQSPIENWPPMSKKAAEQTLDKYGPPNEAIPSPFDLIFLRFQVSTKHSSELRVDAPGQGEVPRGSCFAILHRLGCQCQPTIGALAQLRHSLHCYEHSNYPISSLLALSHVKLPPSYVALTSLFPVFWLPRFTHLETN